MYTTRRSGFDREDARQHYAQLQTRKLTRLPRVGDKVVMNDNVDAQVYTVVEAYSSSCNTRIMVQLKYINDSGRVCKCGAVDASMLLQPSEQQLTHPERKQKMHNTPEQNEAFRKAFDATNARWKAAVAQDNKSKE